MKGPTFPKSTYEDETFILYKSILESSRLISTEILRDPGLFNGIEGQIIMVSLWKPYKSVKVLKHMF
jgi:hypothetical protein